MDGKDLYQPSRDLSLLYPPFAERVQAALQRAREADLDAFVFEGYRLTARQAYLYAKGRSTPGPIVTKAMPGSSWHEYGVAVDIAFAGPGKWHWDGDYDAVAAFMEAEGLAWLGHPERSFVDRPHFQCLWGLKIETARALKKKGGIRAVYAELDRRRDL